MLPLDESTQAKQVKSFLQLHMWCIKQNKDLTLAAIVGNFCNLTPDHIFERKVKKLPHKYFDPIVYNFFFAAHQKQTKKNYLNVKGRHELKKK